MYTEATDAGLSTESAGPLEDAATEVADSLQQKSQQQEHQQRTASPAKYA